ncbi:helix-turn-helix domain-containing protein [Thomasclavelia sp.]
MNTSIDKLKMLTQNEVATILNVSIDNVKMLRELKIIRAIKTGRNYMFSQSEIKLFQDTYAGYDVSNRVEAMQAYEEVNKVITESS